MPPSPRPASPETLSRTLPSSSPRGNVCFPFCATRTEPGRVTLCGVELGQYDSVSLQQARVVGAELPEYIQVENSGSTETNSEASGAFGIRSRGHTARIDAYETSSDRGSMAYSV